MASLSQGSAARVRARIARFLPGIFRILIIMAIAGYGAVIVQNITEMLQGFAHHNAPDLVVEHPFR